VQSKSLPGPVLEIVSGGQTGADRAALDWAIAYGIPHGGWCPAGRQAEDGPIDLRYRLRETTSAEYIERTRANVRDSDGTLIVNLGPLEGGSRDTRDYAEAIGRPCMVVQADDLPAGAVAAWLDRHGIRRLNVAGPRESQRPGIYAATAALLDEVISFPGGS
jgi:hypothetical protein